MSVPPRVLVVDDSATARDIYSTFLSHAGYEVIEAADGSSGLERVEADRPDLVILDVVLPRMDGLEVMRHIRSSATAGDTPIICVTASISDEYRARAGELGCQAFLEKPDAGGRMLDVVRKVLGDRAPAVEEDTA